MHWLTASERRGASILVLILLLGAARDWWGTRRAEEAGLTDVATGYRPSLALPLKEAWSPDPSPAGTGAAGRMDLNRASAGDLEGLPGIGPVLAARIVAHRCAHQRFRRAEDLLAVRGVGPRLFARLRPLIVVTPDESPTRAAGRPTASAGLHSAPSAAPGLADSASARAEPSR